MYPIEVRNRYSIPDNIKNWRVFQDDLEIKKFLELTGEFSNCQIDEEQDDDVDEFPSLQNNQFLIIKLLNSKEISFQRV